MRVHLSFALYLLVAVLAGLPVPHPLEYGKNAGAALLLIAAGVAPLPNQKPSSLLAALGCALLWVYYGPLVWPYVSQPRAEVQMPVFLSHYVVPCLLLAASVSAVATLFATKTKGDIDPPSTGKQSPRAGYPQRIAKLLGHDGPVRAVAFSLNRDLLATGGEDGRVWLWDFHGQKPQQRELGRQNGAVITALAFAPDNQTLAAGTGNPHGIVCVWDLNESAAGLPVSRVSSLPPVRALTFSPDGSLLAYGGLGGGIALRTRARGWRKGPAFQAHRGDVLATAFAPN